LKDRSPEGEEPVDIPILDVGFVSVDVNREVEVVRDELAESFSRLQHIESFEDHDVGLTCDDALVVDDVIDDVAVDRSGHFGPAALDVAKHTQ
jgi:hypothetical protein